MSLFFEDEIQKVKRKIDRVGLDNLMAQDPRDKQRNVDKYRRNSRSQSSSSKDTRNHMNYRSKSKY